MILQRRLGRFGSTENIRIPSNTFNFTELVVVSLSTLNIAQLGL